MFERQLLNDDCYQFFFFWFWLLCSALHFRFGWTGLGYALCLLSFVKYVPTNENAFIQLFGIFSTFGNYNGIAVSLWFHSPYYKCLWSHHLKNNNDHEQAWLSSNMLEIFVLLLLPLLLLRLMRDGLNWNLLFFIVCKSAKAPRLIFNNNFRFFCFWFAISFILNQSRMPNRFEWLNVFVNFKRINWMSEMCEMFVCVCVCVASYLFS